MYLIYQLQDLLSNQILDNIPVVFPVGDNEFRINYVSFSEVLMLTDFTLQSNRKIEFISLERFNGIKMMVLERDTNIGQIKIYANGSIMTWVGATAFVTDAYLQDYTSVDRCGFINIGPFKAKKLSEHNNGMVLVERIK